MANEVLWTTKSGVLTNNQLSKKFFKEAQPRLKFQQFVSFKNALGKSQGQTVNFLKVSNVSSYGGKLLETATIHTTPMPMTWGSLTVTEYGNSIPLTEIVDTLSEFELMSILRQGLLDDAVKCIDGEVEREFNKTPLRYVGTATGGGVLTTNSVATATNSSVLNSYHIRKMKLELEKRNIPGWYNSRDDTEDYAMILSLEAAESLEGALESVNQYTELGLKKIFAGEIGRLHGVRFVRDSFASRFTYDSTARTATAKSWTNSLALDGYMLGANTVMEAVVTPLQIRKKEPTDYGRSRGLAWYMLGGWALIETDATRASIIKWDSGA